MSRTLYDLVPDMATLYRLKEAAEVALDYFQKAGLSSPPGEVKNETLLLLGICHDGASVSEMLSFREFKIVLRFPTSKSLSMRLLRYCRQGLVKRRWVDGEYRYYRTKKGLFYRPNVPLSGKVEQIFGLLRNDWRYSALIQGNPLMDQNLERLFVEHSKVLESAASKKQIELALVRRLRKKATDKKKARQLSGHPIFRFESPRTRFDLDAYIR